MEEEKVLTIGLLGLSFESENKGCAALAYSFLKLLKETAQKNSVKIKLVIITGVNIENFNYIIDKNTILDCEVVDYHFKKIKTQILVRKWLKKCDYIFDFTEGDSFSDIYGLKQFIANTNLKLFCIDSKLPLILGPQTYGPYNKRLSKVIARRIIKKSKMVYTRDDISTDFVKEVSGRKVDTLIDVAFELPYENKKTISDKVRVGINVSGLLWNGGYSGNNDFNLTVDYREYIKRIIDYLCNNDKYEIFLVPHVICNDYNRLENDFRASEEVKEEFPKCTISDKFKTPMEAKTYISQMDLFLRS